MKKKLLVFGGSNSKKSINQRLALHVSSLIQNTEIVELDLNDFEVPIYSIDREKKSGIPKEIQDFTSLIEEVDGLVVSLAEHNGAYTVAFKNILDWSSRHDIGFFKEKPMLLMATSPGGYGGKNVLTLAEKRLPKFKANIVSTFSLPSFNDHFDDAKGITDQTIHKELDQVISSFEEVLGRA